MHLKSHHPFTRDWWRALKKILTSEISDWLAEVGLSTVQNCVSTNILRSLASFTGAGTWLQATLILMLESACCAKKLGCDLHRYRHRWKLDQCGTDILSKGMWIAAFRCSELGKVMDHRDGLPMNGNMKGKPGSKRLRDIEERSLLCVSVPIHE